MTGFDLLILMALLAPVVVFAGWHAVRQFAALRAISRREKGESE